MMLAKSIRRWSVVAAAANVASIFGAGDLLTPFEREGCQLAGRDAPGLG